MPIETSTTRPGGIRDRRVVRARSQVAGALVVAETGRPAEAERKLRDALGVLERRHRYAAAARAAATLGYLLRERGDVMRAESTFQRARVLFDVASPVTAAPRTRPPEREVEEAEREDYVQAKALLTTARPTVDETGIPSASRGSGDGPRLSNESDSVVSAVSRLTRALGEENNCLHELCSCLRTLINAHAVALCQVGQNARTLAAAGHFPCRMKERLLVVMPPTGEMATARDERHAGMTMGVYAEGKAIAHILVCGARDRCDGRSTPIGDVVRLAAVLCASEVEYAIGRQLPPREETLGGLIGVSAEMQDLRVAIKDASRCPFPVLIEGETGTGKELVARALHHSGDRGAGVFCAVNCAALTDELFEAELFGYARGAFTGAVSQRPGLFEEAHLGTLFLDEVGELSIRAQAKLLRAVQEGEVRRLGENNTRRVDVRLVAATNRELAVEVAAGRFRQDLFFRMAVVRMHVPPLRDRRDDITLLLRHFWRVAQEQTHGRSTLGADVIEAFLAYDWPGNVRELENVVAALSVRAPPRGRVPIRALPTALARVSNQQPATRTMTLGQAREASERACVRAALVRALGRPGVAARELGISRQGLAKLMKRLALTRDG